MSIARITHIGGPTVLVEVDGWRILTDPTFDAPGRTYHFGYGSASTKVNGPAIDASAVGPLDAILLTHDHHADNLDDAGRTLLPGAGVVVTTTSGAGRLGGAARGLSPWETTVLEAPGKPAITITATPCRHGPPFSHPIVGDVVGFALSWDGLRHGALWFSGDTVLYDGVRAVGERIDVGVAFLHMGEARFGITGPVRYTMSAHGAIELCEAVLPALAIPVHYEGWSHFREGRAAIEQALADAPALVRSRFRFVEIGEPTDVEL
jgi:L-ascorbate metabolism protein UlaG (beta-lactamase superfamily)